MNDIVERDEKTEKKFYVFGEARPNMKEIPSDIVTCANRRAWSYKHGYSAIGCWTVNDKWYAFN